jgi:hypothetical protein
MEQQRKVKRFEAGFVIDTIQSAIAILAAAALALDSTGLLAFPWLQKNLQELTFIAISALIVASALERRFTIRASQEKVDKRIDTIGQQLKTIQESISGFVSIDSVLKNRADYNRPIEAV